jgi:hypothetical protein
MDTAEVKGHDLDDIVSFLEVVFAVDDEGGDSKGGKVTDGCFFWRRVFDDFGAEIQ